ncbi:MAG TPA: putative glycoside hydrolase [Bacillota bacterium]|nr:putative glycoside hydrolase [Bacillota bacterium]HPT86472.1 putative glycoside hydrolase [Bacillota bacterium]
MQKKRLEASNLPTIIRPWLQDFSLKSRYDRKEIQAQIRAVEDAGLTEWIFWNPSNNYRIEKYQP